MSFLFSSSNPFYELLDKATSENIPGAEEDIALNLDIADLIKSKKIPANDAVNAIKKKLDNSNPNVQILAIKLLDCCIKNSGNHFLVKVSQKDIVDTMASIIRSSLTNPKLKTIALTYFQNWAIAFRSKPDLYYLPNVYKDLRAEGYRFPSCNASEASGVLIDTQTAPEWINGDSCMRCRTNFTFSNRKHHCRNCGMIFCNDCSSKNIPIPSLGYNDPVRVCESCYYKITNPSSNASKPNNNSSNFVDFNDDEFYYSNDYMDNLDISTNHHDPIASKEEEEFKRAIELSLKEAEKAKNKSNDSSRNRSRTFTADEEPENSEEEEEQLKKAIEASLQEAKISESNKSNNNINSIDQHIEPTNPDELLTTEVENIKLFSQLMEKISAEVPVKGPQVINDTQIQALHYQISSLHPKVMKNKIYYEEKYKKFNDIHEKLLVATRLYDQILSQRLDAARTSTYSSVGLYQTSPQLPLQNYNYNPYGYSAQAPPASIGTTNPTLSRENMLGPQNPPSVYGNIYPTYLQQPVVQSPAQQQPPTQLPVGQPVPSNQSIYNNNNYYGQAPVQQTSQQLPPPQQSQVIPPQDPQGIPPSQEQQLPAQPPQQPSVTNYQDMNLLNKQQAVPSQTGYATNTLPYASQPNILAMPNTVPEALPQVQSTPYAMPPQQQAPPPEPVEEKPLIEL